MRTHVPRYPRARSIVTVVAALSVLPVDEPARSSWRYSESGTPNLRYSATSRNTPWLVDIYVGHYYRAQIGNGLATVCRSIPSLLGYLGRGLGFIDTKE